MNWPPPSSEVKNVKPGLKMRDLKPSIVSRVFNQREKPVRVAAPRLCDQILEKMKDENRMLSAEEITHLLGRKGRSAVREALNELKRDNLVRPFKLRSNKYWVWELIK